MITRAAFEQQEKAIAEFIKRYGQDPLKRERGRPRTGIRDAIRLAIQVEEFWQSGMTRAEAVQKVSELTRKTTAHISLCHSMVSEHDLDRLENRRVRMANRALVRKRRLQSTRLLARRRVLTVKK
jgi:DNA-directed RNA polymerase beta subunit